ncbi:MAG: putative membrane protein [uncultured Propionibacteriaceae bacterium]|uniref:Putative membrane protein n=1 Tax=uncultured Propionibacteriaceae bacterium TaxID=257457 RepID=A0A6J4P578_9ACTN|nr:MAG: putative membrane protein [uncultured Propionibacteriaceae bacterium]
MGIAAANRPATTTVACSTMSLTADRELDIVLVGATGFVGRLTAQHLALHSPPTTRIGLAARSSERLTRMQADLPDRARQWPLITLDVTDSAATTVLAGRTRVVVSTVGPYLRYGLPLVQACATAGTDYADLTGETLFARRAIDACHDVARATGARIVPACGFDSVPSDLGVGLTAAVAAADGHSQLADTVLHVRAIRGGISGGTIDSLRHQILHAGTDRALRAVARDPMALAGGSDPAAEPRTRRPRRRLIERDPRTGGYQTRFVMGGFNRQIVLRSNEIAGRPYGPQFHYREVVDTGTGPAGAAKAAVIAAGSTAVMAGMMVPPTRWLLDAVLPSPGAGPSVRTRRRGRFLLEVEAATPGGPRYRTRIAADQDPGYAATAVMLAQSAFALANDEDLPDRAGVLTPMTALGENLAARLRAQDFRIETRVVRD